ncbi:MAG TPA: DNA translocase FtsK 4TM domain-containing protein [Rubricoccaceae bacterium]
MSTAERSSRPAPRKRAAPRSSGGHSRAAEAAVTIQRKQEVLGILLMALAVLLALAVVSHTPADDARLAGVARRGLFEFGDNRLDNLLGVVGAFAARLFVTEALGFPVLLLLAALLAWGYVLLRQKTPVFLPLLSVLAVTGAVFAACFFGWFDIHTDTDLARWSGGIGTGVAQWMSGVLGSVGAFIVLVVGLVITVLLAVDRDIQTSLDRVEGAAVGVKTGLTDGWAAFRTGSAARKHLRQEARAVAFKERAEKSAARDRDREATLAEAKKAARERVADERRAAAEAPEAISAPRPTGDGARDADPDDRHDGLPVLVVPASGDGARPVPPRFPAPVAPDAETDDPDLDGLVDDEREAGPAVHVHVAAPEAVVDLDAAAATATALDVEYQFPSIELLEQAESDQQVDMAEIEENKLTLLDKLQTYNIQITEIDAVVGPTVTRYELTPAPGIKISRITALEDDLAMALAAPGIRIIAPIPGKSAIGVEIPNRSREMVRLRQTLSTPTFRDAARGGKMALPIPIGKTIEGGVYVEDLAKMPHLLVAGATGSGKSVGVNALIVGLLYAKQPADLKFVMIDPKKIELNGYATLLNHFSAMPVDAEDPIITDFSQAAAVLRSCEREMELRYDLLAEAGVRGIVEYNDKFARGALVSLGGKHRHLPYLVVIVDELADLMMTSAKEVEAPIARLAQMARAVGIHLVLATQRPSVDVITGLIKANFPSRMAYQTSSKIDSRTIIDGGGAHQLVGNGDLLHMNGSRLTRLQGPYVSVEEVEAVTGFIGAQDGPGPYLLPPMDPHEDAPAGAAGDSSEDRDDLFADAARVIVRSQQGSVSLLQRKLSVGYTRAARLVDQLEDAGIVGPFEGSKAREVLVTSEYQLDEMLNPGSGLGDDPDEA